jgi:predicted ATPase
LIILDNCEHVIEDCARIVHALLLACPGLKIMATSREALGVTGEVAYPVPSLPVPEASHLPPLEQLAQNPSVRLFEERARAVKPGFAITTDNASAVTQVCKRLDGIPLALELAAARMNAFSPAQIAERLDNRFRLLTGGARTALPRQQTLRASIDWSFSLLEETERLLLLRLSVFQGGWTLELAQEVCAFDGLDEYDVIEGLAQLVNKSLVIAETAPDGSTRYHRLETIRQYAREKLLDSGNSEVLYDRHLEAFLGLVDKARPHLRRHRHLEWLDRLELEMDNLRAALTWALESDVAKGLRIMTSSYWLWHCRGYWLEGEKWFRLLQEKVVALENGVDRALLAEAMGDQAWIMIMAGMWEQRGQRIIDEALSLAQGLGEAHKQLRATLLFFQAYYMGNTKLIRKNVLQSLKIAEEIDDKYLITECLMILANIEPDKAKKKALLERRLRLEEELGDEDGMMTTQLIFGSYYQNFGEVAQAIQMFERGIQMARKLRHSYGWMGGLTSFGKTYYTLGNADKAIETFQQRLHVALDLGEQFHIVQSYYFLGCAYGLKGDWDLAEGYGLQAIEAARINQLSFAEACACFTLAEVAWSLGKDEIAVQFYHKAVGLYGVWDENNFMVGYSAYSSGMEWVLLNDLSSAMKYFQKALRKPWPSAPSKRGIVKKRSACTGLLSPIWNGI